MAPKKEDFSLVLKKGIDIVSKIGGIATLEGAKPVLEQRLDKENYDKLSAIRTEEVLIKIANAIVMCDPDSVFINTGSEADKAFIRKLSLEKGEEEALPMKDHTIHYDLKDEQGRIIDRTYYIVNEDEQISSLANRMERSQAMDEIQEIMVSGAPPQARAVGGAGHP